MITFTFKYPVNNTGDARVDDAVNARGWGNGYVILPKDHAFHSHDCDHINEYVKCHGDLTMAQLDIKWVDFESDSGVEPNGSWVIGFDTSHRGDNKQNCSEAYVKSQLRDLCQQLEKYSFTTNTL